VSIPLESERLCTGRDPSPSGPKEGRKLCRLGTAEIARAFLVSEPALAQRLVRAKRKIAEAVRI